MSSCSSSLAKGILGLCSVPGPNQTSMDYGEHGSPNMPGSVVAYPQPSISFTAIRARNAQAAIPSGWFP